MFILLFAIFGLMLWSVRLMISAFQQSDFSLLFAGTLVAMSAAGIMTAYSLMNGCMGYLSTSDTIASSNFQDGYSIRREVLRSNEESLWVEDIPMYDTSS